MWSCIQGWMKRSEPLAIVKQQAALWGADEQVAGGGWENGGDMPQARGLRAVFGGSLSR